MRSYVRRATRQGEASRELLPQTLFARAGQTSGRLLGDGEGVKKTRKWGSTFHGLDLALQEYWHIIQLFPFDDLDGDAVSFDSMSRAVPYQTRSPSTCFPGGSRSDFGE